MARMRRMAAPLCVRAPLLLRLRTAKAQKLAQHGRISILETTSIGSYYTLF